MQSIGATISTPTRVQANDDGNVVYGERTPSLDPPPITISARPRRFITENVSNPFYTDVMECNAGAMGMKEPCAKWGIQSSRCAPSADDVSMRDLQTSRQQTSKGVPIPPDVWTVQPHREYAVPPENDSATIKEKEDLSLGCDNWSEKVIIPTPGVVYVGPAPHRLQDTLQETSSEECPSALTLLDGDEWQFLSSKHLQFDDRTEVFSNCGEEPENERTASCTSPYPNEVPYAPVTPERAADTTARYSRGYVLALSVTAPPSSLPNQSCILATISERKKHNCHSNLEEGVPTVTVIPDTHVSTCSVAQDVLEEDLPQPLVLSQPADVNDLQRNGGSRVSASLSSAEVWRCGSDGEGTTGILAGRQSRSCSGRGLSSSYGCTDATASCSSRNTSPVLRNIVMPGVPFNKHSDMCGLTSVDVPSHETDDETFPWVFSEFMNRDDGSSVVNIRRRVCAPLPSPGEVAQATVSNGQLTTDAIVSMEDAARRTLWQEHRHIFIQTVAHLHDMWVLANHAVPESGVLGRPPPPPTPALSFKKVALSRPLAIARSHHAITEDISTALPSGTVPLVKCPVIPMQLLYTVLCDDGEDVGMATVDSYFSQQLKLHHLRLKHILFDAMYNLLVACPALQMLEMHARRLLCVQRDLFILDRIELFMLTRQWRSAPTNGPGIMRPMKVFVNRFVRTPAVERSSVSHAPPRKCIMTCTAFGDGVKPRCNVSAATPSGASRHPVRSVSVTDEGRHHLSECEPTSKRALSTSSRVSDATPRYRPPPFYARNVVGSSNASRRPTSALPRIQTRRGPRPAFRAIERSRPVLRERTPPRPPTEDDFCDVFACKR